jgi:hypothetical protein
MTQPYFCIFCNYLPFEEDLALYFNNLEFPLPKDDLIVPSLIEICLLVLEKIFKNFQCIFISSWARAFPFI